jgi:mannitol-specific phosphotransferase system IIBC component
MARHAPELVAGMDRNTHAVLVDSSGFATKATPDSVVFMKKGAAIEMQCAVTYSVAQSLVTAESIIKLDTNGC